ncbi:MAG: hypothetical protein VYC56_03045 [Actinomycetota bacterium]|nr:hypothetical protein [Actinomycetota bacterium]MEC9394943.1 hypothetical protein [Actinomycetota bacterium]MEE2957359.1 hypothetical protein [Actinomycetota bacterium]
MRRFRSLSPLLLVAVLAAACVASGEPVSWEDQADDSGQGLVEREFIAACVEANEDLGAVKAKVFCGCVLGEVQDAVTFEEFKELDDFIDKHRDEVTSGMLTEHFGWFIEATEACPG